VQGEMRPAEPLAVGLVLQYLSMPQESRGGGSKSAFEDVSGKGRNDLLATRTGVTAPLRILLPVSQRWQTGCRPKNSINA